ncbi:hypothetical protein FI667_g6081, partial [Globisporangium splendens]
MNRVSILVLALALLHAPTHAHPNAATPAPTTVSPFWSPPGWPQKWLFDGSQPATLAPFLGVKNANVGGAGKGNVDENGNVLGEHSNPTPTPVMAPAPLQGVKIPGKSGQSGEKPSDGKGAPVSSKNTATSAPSKGETTPASSKDATTPASSKGAAILAPPNIKDLATPAPTSLNGGKPHHDGNPPPNNGGGDKNPTNCPKDSVMVSVEGRGSFCVSSVGAICAGDNGSGRCPKKQPGLEKGSHCGKVRSGVFGCLPGSDPVKKCDVKDED